MGTPKQTYTRQTLEETPERALTFLAGVGTNAGIRRILATRGYTAEEHKRGWKLLHAATGYEDAPVLSPPDDKAASQALAEIDSWDEPNFRIARAALGHTFPAQAEFLFHELAAATGAAALLSVRTFLERLDMLEGKLTGREHTDKQLKKQDQGAVTRLAERGITAAERDRLRKLLAVAEGGNRSESDSSKAAAEANAASREQALLELRGFYDEWSEVAKVVITRRDYLIRLGLAQRKMNKKDEEPSEPGSTPSAK